MTDIAETTSLEAEIARLREELAATTLLARRAADRGEVENLFNRYMFLHNAFQDEQIIPLWVKEGTPGIRAQYTNAGVYTTWESVTRYHRGRPSPVGKLILHATTTPVIEVAGDAETARGVWLMAGTESGLTDPAVAEAFPDMYSPKATQFSSNGARASSKQRKCQNLHSPSCFRKSISYLHHTQCAQTFLPCTSFGEYMSG
ncbi:MAG: nuclear transport factor 2 family protein, partial [Curtobacterium sp.]